MLEQVVNNQPMDFSQVQASININKLASRRVTGWNGREFFALWHSSKVHFHPLV